MQKLTLYYLPTCPYCKKVLDFLAETKINVELKNREDEDNLNELIEIGGKKQVPCLVIDRHALYESDEIIDWLKKHANH